MQQSQELNELFSALSKAQAEFSIAAKDANNPFFKSKYTDLSGLVKASRPALTKYGLSVIQTLDQNILITTLGHASGQWISSSMGVNPAKTDIQSLGSYLTYLRRYMYAAIVGVVTGDEDDDGESAVGRFPAKNTISQKDIEALAKFLEPRPQLNESLKAKYKIMYWDELPQSQLANVGNDIRAVLKDESEE